MSPPSLLFLFVKTMQWLLPVALLSIIIDLARADPPYDYCSVANNSYLNGFYQNNAKNLLPILTSNATTKKFFYFTIGTYPNQAYGMFLCIDFITNTVCNNCTLAATQALGKKCPNSTDATVWQDQCQIRVSNRNFFGHLNVTGNIAKYNAKEVSDPKKFRSVLNASLSELAKVAAFNKSVHMYATREVPFSDTDTIYSLVQCTPDLSPDDCNICLQTATVEVLESYQFRGGRLLSRSCYLRYELYAFYKGKTEPSAFSGSSHSKGSRRKRWIVPVIAVAVVCVLLALLGSCVHYFLSWRKMKGSRKIVHEIQLKYVSVSSPTGSPQQRFEGTGNPMLDLSAIHAATGYFSDANKLGEGGFGPVYKGQLEDGTRVAVKRLSNGSEQGAEEFTNEVLLIMKLQHKNLVRLLGFCVDGEERMLVYELMPNKALDYFLYDPERRAKLNWTKRKHIIHGIARGILYLHEDSRLRIIHRDIKPSNVLLDNDMNPKISDFGMARIYGGDAGDASTSIIVGTYGYMAPEYAMHGIYSNKSDVFSFGIILLEMVTGIKSIGFHLTGNGPSLQAYVWRLWNQQRGLELIDPLLKDSCSADELLRCIHVALYCVQEDALDRPPMSSVIQMLKNETRYDLQTPNRPAFTLGRSTDHNNESSESSCVNSITVSEISGR